MDATTIRLLEENFSSEISAAGLSMDKLGGGREVRDLVVDYSEQLAQREHFDWYADHPDADYADYADMPFWSAVDEVTYDYWSKIMPSEGFFLDIGCANGRSAMPLVAPNRMVVGFDISRAMVVKGMQVLEEKRYSEQAAFFVADGSVLPFQDDVFECAQTYGVLHHLPDPGTVIKEAQRVLKPGGIHLGSENNETAFRPIFDWFMKYFTLWHEEAGEEPLISHEMLFEWLKDLKVTTTVHTSVFLPPHLCNLVGRSLSRVLLNVSDCVLRMIPWVGQNGGLIVFEIRKPKS